AASPSRGSAASRRAREPRRPGRDAVRSASPARGGRGVSDDFLSVVQSKRFLGREFLTWLVHRAEEGEARVEDDGQMTEVQLGDRAVLAGGADGRARLTIVGEGDVRAEIGAGLRRGKLLDRARLVLVRGERRWELLLDGGMLAYEAVRCPAL